MKSRSLRTVLPLLALLGTGVGAGSAVAQDYDDGPPRWHHHHGWDGPPPWAWRRHHRWHDEGFDRGGGRRGDWERGGRQERMEGRGGSDRGEQRRRDPEHNGAGRDGFRSDD